MVFQLSYIFEVSAQPTSGLEATLHRLTVFPSFDNMLLTPKNTISY